MKKLCLVAALAVFSLFNVNAQDTSFGVKGGIDLYSNKVNNGVASFSGSATGFYVGGFAEIGLSDEFSFQPEVLYVSFTGGGMVHVPLMAKYGVSDEFSIVGGPAVGFLTSTGPGQKSLNYGVEAGVAL